VSSCVSARLHQISFLSGHKCIRMLTPFCQSLLLLILDSVSLLHDSPGLFPQCCDSPPAARCVPFPRCFLSLFSQESGPIHFVRSALCYDATVFCFSPFKAFFTTLRVALFAKRRSLGLFLPFAEGDLIVPESEFLLPQELFITAGLKYPFFLDCTQASYRAMSYTSLPIYPFASFCSPPGVLNDVPLRQEL